MLLSSLALYMILTLSQVSSWPVHQLSNGGGVSSKCKKAGSFAVTFDDGPSGKNTEALLDSLKSRGIKVTFFVVGQMLKDDSNVKLLQRAYKEGHHIASHTYTHSNLKKLSAKEIREEMKQTEDAIQKAIGVKPKYMRPPFGSYSKEALKILKEMGYTVITWDVDTLDWKTKSAAKTLGVYAKLLKKADPAKDSFLSLEHDIIKSSTQHVDQVIDAIQNKGFTLTTVPGCLGRTDLYQ